MKGLQLNLVRIAMANINSEYNNLMKNLSGTEREGIFDLVENIAENIISGEAKLLLSSIDPGVGKSTAIICTLRAWETQGFFPRGGIIVALSRVKEINEYVAKLGCMNGGVAVLTSDDALPGELGVASATIDNAPILITTQQMLASKLKGKSFAEAAAFHFHGEPRSLVIWDESFLPSLPVTLRCDSLKGLVEPLRPLTTDFAEELEAFLSDASKLEAGDALSVPTRLEIIGADVVRRGSAAFKALTIGQQRTRNALAVMGGRTVRIFDDRYHGRVLVGSTAPLPADFPTTIVTDASIRVRQTYKLLSGAIPLKDATLDYAPLRIRLWNRGCSKSTLRQDKARESILDAVASLINEQPSRQWLVVVPKRSDALDIPSELNAKLINVARVGYVEWGSHFATNDFRGHRAVVVLGTFAYSRAGYASVRVAASGGVAKAAVSIDDIAAGETCHNILQAVCRSNVRNSNGGKCGEAEVYVIGKGGKLPAQLETTFPGATVEPWRTAIPALPGKAGKLVDELAKSFADPNERRIKKDDLRKRLGIPHDSGLAPLMKKPGVREALERLGIASERQWFVRATDTAATQIAPEWLSDWRRNQEVGGRPFRPPLILVAIE